MTNTSFLSHRAIVHIFNGRDIIKNKSILLYIYIYSNYIFFRQMSERLCEKKGAQRR